MKVEITPDVVETVARLVKLRLTNEEVQHYQTQLSKILNYVHEIETMADTLPQDWRGDTFGDSTPERRDQILVSAPVEELIAGAPQKIGTAFQVPKIIE